MPLTDFLLIIVLSLASYRVWRLVGYDDISTPIRLRLQGFGPSSYDGTPWLLKLIECPWCLGTWLSLLSVYIFSLYHPLPYPVLWYLAVPTLVGLIGNIDE